MKELTVIVESQHNQPLPSPIRCKLTEDILSIGRSSHNQLTLDDKRRGISRVHCRIQRQGDTFEITDESSNGLFINNASTPLGRGNRRILQHNDELKLGPYQLRIAILDRVEKPPVSAPGDHQDDPQEGTQFLPVNPERDLPPVFHKPQGFNAPGRPRQPVENEPITRLSETPPPPAARPKPAVAPPAPPPQKPNPLEDLTGTAVPQYPNPAQPPQPPASDQPPPGAIDAEEQLPELDDLLSVEPAGNATAQPASAPDEFSIDDLLAGEDFGPSPGLPPGAADSDDLASLDNLLMDLPPTPAQNSDVKPPRGDSPGVSQPPPSSAPQPPPTAPVTPRQEPLSTPPSATPAPATATRQTVDDGSTALFKAFLEGLGLPPGALASTDQRALFRDVGKILRMTTENLILMLEARGLSKEEMNMDRTMMQSTGNNPLKFPRGDLHATLAVLLASQGQAYLPRVQAFSEAFDDLNNHYTGNLRGFTAALRDLLARFEPAALEERLNEHSRITDMFPGNRAARCWDAYRELYKDIAEQSEENFLELIEASYVEAYRESQDGASFPHDESD